MDQHRHLHSAESFRHNVNVLLSLMKDLRYQGIHHVPDQEITRNHCIIVCLLNYKPYKQDSF